MPTPAPQLDPCAAPVQPGTADAAARIGTPGTATLPMPSPGAAGPTRLGAPSGDWLLRLHPGPDGRSSWQAEAMGPGGAHAFASIAELVRWLVQLDPAAGRGIR